MRERLSRLRPALILFITLLIGILYWRGAALQLTLVNTDMKATDQSAYMDYARQMVETNYTFAGGRNRMPAYPFLQSLFYDPEMSDEEFFLQGKTINVVLSMILLVGTAVILSRFLGRLLVLNLMLILTFTVFVFKAGFFQAELLFYFLTFCLFLLMWRMIRKPSWYGAVLTGLVAGTAHLTKASVIPGLVIFLISFGLEWLVRIIKRDPLDKRAVFVEKSFYYRPIYAVVAVLCFLAVIYPYIRTSKEIFGHYFYNVNSTFYIWYDSWDEAKEGTRSHGDRVGWPDMPAEEIPSLAKYLREHSSRQIVERFLQGAILITDKAIQSYGYFKYFVIYALLLVLAMIRYNSQAIHLLRSHITLGFFLIAYFSAYFLLYAWYSAISFGGNRLILAQFLPLMFTILVGIQELLVGKETTMGTLRINSLTLINLAVLLLLVVNIWVILTQTVGTMYGGS